MSVATTPLEKFLLQAIRTVKEEIHEEVDALLEGSEKETSGSTIKKILDDLLCSAEHFDSFDIEEINFSESRVFKYKSGEIVDFSGAIFMELESKAKLFGYKNLYGFDSDPPETPGEAEIIDWAFDLSAKKECYVVQMNEKLYFTDEEELFKKR